MIDRRLSGLGTRHIPEIGISGNNHRRGSKEQKRVVHKMFDITGIACQQSRFVLHSEQESTKLVRNQIPRSGRYYYISAKAKNRSQLVESEGLIVQCEF